MGRRTRTISPALRRALDIRDRGCRFPGCGLRFTDAHHVRHWADGGETSLGNCVLLCRHHHRLVHGGGWRLEWWGRGRPVFYDPRGGMHFDGRFAQVRDAEKAAVEAAATTEATRRAAVEAVIEAAPGGPSDPGPAPETQPAPGPLTAGSRWRSEWDIPEALRLRAIEAMRS
ncbi:MAG: HNH endonuclease signature motif containing protein [Gemmatimonadota bacterium]